MNGLRLVFVLLNARLRSSWRFLAANAFVLFVLGPLILGSGLWIAWGYLDLLRKPLADLVAGDLLGAVGFAIVLLVTLLALPSQRREIFPIRAADGYLDALAVSESVRFHVAVVWCLVRQLPIAILLLVFLAVLGGENATPGRQAAWLLHLLAGLVPLTLIGMVAVQLRVRLARPTWRRGRPLAFLLAVLGGFLSAVYLLPSHLLPSYLLPSAKHLVVLLPWRASAVQVQIALADALGVSAVEGTAAERLMEGQAGAWAWTVLLFYPLALGLYVGYRRRDLEQVRALVGNSSASRLRFWPGRAQPALKAQIERDLTLILRRFSPAVYLVVALALVIEAGAFLVVPSLGFPPEWTRRAAIFTSVGAALSLVSLVPLLLKHQLPRFWMEKSTGVAPEHVWGTKLWLARLLTLPAVALSGALLWTLPTASADPLATGLAFLQLLMATWVVASTVGYTAFEIAAQPVLGLIFSALVGMALGGLFVFKASAWWLWLPFYLVLASKLAERADRRIRFTEVES